ncbi:hypothetical protein TNCV_1158111 [Trichonephila clavipes]|nr:hypothetical protein TNCV_1158111 [Trichonephila clavipes]
MARVHSPFRTSTPPNFELRKIEYTSAPLYEGSSSAPGLEIRTHCPRICDDNHWASDAPCHGSMFSHWGGGKVMRMEFLVT